ncbi:MAG: [protein-PII] uridylyltransferase [Deltaproteobacteria bacterium]|nr:[protein-PII] uridylyltransferase [Deltaproteobacteria bacterium]
MTAARRVDLVALQPGLPATCKAYLARERALCEQAIADGEGGIAVARRLAAAYDGLLSTLWAAAQAALGAGPGPGRARKAGRTTLVAVGGYARRRMGLRSDVDLLFLCERRSDDAADAIAEAILYPLWDLGVQVGHVVRTPEECVELARSDLKTATALLEGRRVAGDETLAAVLGDDALRSVFSADLETFLDRLRADATARHARFGGSLYLLEPDVKNGRGGLRDLDAALWAAKAAYRVGGMEDLVRIGMLSNREWDEVRAADDFLWRVRHCLHRRAGRCADRLGFEDQEEIARLMGYVDGVDLGVEQFMKCYYGHARLVAARSDALIERCTPEHHRRSSHTLKHVGEGLKLFDGRITVTDPRLVESDPAVMLRALRIAAFRDVPLYSYMRDLVTRELGGGRAAELLRASSEAARDLRLLVSRFAARTAGPPILEEAHDLGLVCAMIPEFSDVTGRVQHDVYHVYTVDVHSLHAVERLHALERGELASDFPHVSRVAGEVAGREVLAMAVLLHDVGKGRGPDHSALGAEMAHGVCLRLGMPGDDADRVSWLVREHLAMYRYAMQRDVSDPSLVEDFAGLVGTTERLRDLYVLTFADLSTTGPTVMTDWKATMLAELYERTAQLLEGRAADRAEADVARRSVLSLCPPSTFAAEFVDSLPDRYFLVHSPDAVLRHMDACRARGAKPVHVVSSDRPAELSAELVVVCDDRPGILARIACALTANRIDVLSAQIHSRSNGEVVDSFLVRGLAGRKATDPALVARVEKDLGELLSDRVTPEALLAERRPPPVLREKTVPRVRTKVEVDNRVSPTHTVIDVYTRDRVGVLYTIAQALAGAGLSIDVSRLASEGVRVADSFYVTEVGGGKVEDPERLQVIRSAVEDALGRLHAGTNGG